MKKVLILALALVSSCVSTPDKQTQATGVSKNPEYTVEAGYRTRVFDEKTTQTVAVWITKGTSRLDTIRVIYLTLGEKPLVPPELNMDEFAMKRPDQDLFFFQVNGKDLNLDSLKLKLETTSTTLVYDQLGLRVLKGNPQIENLEQLKVLSNMETQMKFKNLSFTDYEYQIQVYSEDTSQLVYDRPVTALTMTCDFTGLEKGKKYLVGILQRDKENIRNVVSREYLVTLK